MKRLAINVTVVFITLAIGIGITKVTSVSVQAPVNREAEEYAVYSDLINSFQPQSGKHVLLIAGKTISTIPHDRDIDVKAFARDHLPETAAIANETFEDYKLVDSQPLDISNRFSLNRKYILISNQEAKSYFENSNAVLSLRNKYPDSSGRILMLSRVGFNKKLDEALVHVWAYCGGDCGGGGYYLLRKENGVWKVRDKKILIS